MTTFDKREEGFEKKFAHRRGTAVQGRRPPQQASWACGPPKSLGFPGAEAEAYAKSVVVADFEEAGDEDVFRKIRADFDAKSVRPVGPPDPPHHGRADGHRPSSRSRQPGKWLPPIST